MEDFLVWIAAHSKKLIFAWGGWSVGKYLGAIGLHTWGDFAGMASGFLTCLLIGDFLWKKWRGEKPKRGARK
jgi:hypothetical protein